MSELERRLLGNLLGKPDEINTVSEMGLRSEVFEELVCGAIFNYIIDYWRNEGMKMAPTMSVINTEFPGIELPLDEELSTSWMAQRIKNSYAANQVQLMMMEAAKLTLEDPEGAVKFLQAQMHEAAEILAPRHSRWDMATSVNERRQLYLDRAQGDGQGVTLGLPELDAHINGLMPSELAIVGAYSKTGKTMLLANAAVAARNAGLTPIFFTLEMPKEEIGHRLDAMYSGLSYDRISNSRLTVEEMSILHAKQDELAALGPLLIEQPEDDDRTAAALVSRARYAGADLIIIDQLSEMNPGRRVKDLKEHHSTCMKQLKTEIGRGSRGRLPCLLAVQFNRQSQSRHEGIGLDSFANATEVEAICDLALGLWRNEEMYRSNQMKMSILGARRSRRMHWILHWHLVRQTSIAVSHEVPE